MSVLNRCACVYVDKMCYSLGINIHILWIHHDWLRFVHFSHTKQRSIQFTKMNRNVFQCEKKTVAQNLRDETIYNSILLVFRYKFLVYGTYIQIINIHLISTRGFLWISPQHQLNEGQEHVHQIAPSSKIRTD